MNFRLEKKEKPEQENSHDKPSHYKLGGSRYNCIDEMVMLFGPEAVRHFCMCNIYKYRYRAIAKGGQEDLDKANRYVEYLVHIAECEKKGVWRL